MMNDEMAGALAREIVLQAPRSLCIRDSGADQGLRPPSIGTEFAGGTWERVPPDGVSDPGAVPVYLANTAVDANELLLSLRAAWREGVTEFSVNVPMDLVGDLLERNRDLDDLAAEVAGDLWAIIMEDLAHRRLQDVVSPGALITIGA